MIKTFWTDEIDAECVREAMHVTVENPSFNRSGGLRHNLHAVSHASPIKLRQLLMSTMETTLNYTFMGAARVVKSCNP